MKWYDFFCHIKFRCKYIYLSEGYFLAIIVKDTNIMCV